MSPALQDQVVPSVRGGVWNQKCIWEVVSTGDQVAPEERTFQMVWPPRPGVCSFQQAFTMISFQEMDGGPLSGSSGKDSCIYTYTYNVRIFISELNDTKGIWVIHHVREAK